MSQSLKTAIQYGPLHGKKAELEARLDPSQRRTLMRKRVVPPLLGFELARLRQHAGVVRTVEPRLDQLEGMVEFLVHLGKKVAELGLEDLLRLHRLLAPGDDLLRRNSGTPLSSHHEPLAPSAISSALVRFFEWIQSPSFSEIHPVEQMTLCQLRLYDIYPFEVFSEVTTSLFSYYFMAAEAFLLPVYRLEELPDFYAALDAAFAFSTQGLIDFNLRACVRSYEVMGSDLQRV